MKRARLIILATLAVLALYGPLSAAAETTGKQWEFSITPYLWLPNINGTLNYSAPSGSQAARRFRWDRSTISKRSGSS